MKIYSNTLTTNDLFAAKPMGVFIVDCTEIRNPRTKDEDGRPYKRGWNVYLEGSSSYRSQHEDAGGYGMAATWDEWGLWMVELYRLDPEVKIGWYENYNHFIEMTTHTRDHYANQNTKRAQEHRAPWLEDKLTVMPMSRMWDA